jgi:hypothetical protein
MSRRRYEFSAAVRVTIDGSEAEARKLAEEFLELGPYNGVNAELDEGPADVEEEDE